MSSGPTHAQGALPSSARATAAAPSNTAGTARISSQMDAVVRLITGREERTIAEKFADSNRPTWEQYKKDNHDKLNLDNLDQQKMEEYRRQLDEQRDRLLAAPSRSRSFQRKSDRSKDKKRKGGRDEDDDNSRSSGDADSDSSSEDYRRHRRKKHKKKHKKERRRHRDDRSDDGGEGENREERRRKKKRRRREDNNASTRDYEQGNTERDDGIQQDP